MTKESFVIYYNPRCGKCRTAKSTLEDNGNTCTIIEYLHNPPTKKELVSLLKKLGKKPLDIIRKKESIFIHNYIGKNLTDNQWIDAILKDPILLERPIVVKGEKAWVARSEEVLDEIK